MCDTLERIAANGAEEVMTGETARFALLQSSLFPF